MSEPSTWTKPRIRGKHGLTLDLRKWVTDENYDRLIHGRSVRRMWLLGRSYRRYMNRKVCQLIACCSVKPSVVLLPSMEQYEAAQ